MVWGDIWIPGEIQTDIETHRNTILLLGPGREARPSGDEILRVWASFVLEMESLFTFDRGGLNTQLVAAGVFVKH